MTSYNLLPAILAVAATVAAYRIARPWLTPGAPRVWLMLGLTGLLWWSGLGIGFLHEWTTQALLFSVFVIACAAAFAVAYATLKPDPSRPPGSAQYPFVDAIIAHRKWVIAVYMGVLTARLIYPDFLLFRLLDPVRPQLTDFTGLRTRLGPIEYALQYAQLLSFPIFLIALTGLSRWWMPLLWLAARDYLLFCHSGYFARGDLVRLLWVCGVYLWFLLPHRRRRIAVVYAVMAPVVVMVLLWLGSVRAAVDNRQVHDSNLEAVSHMLHSQVTFPEKAQIVLESGNRVDPVAYARWLATLWLPKAITGRFDVAEVNYEISEIITGLRPGDRNYTVTLTGLVTESVYLFGKDLFWLHALFLGGLFGALCSQVLRSRRFMMIGAWLTFEFGYHLARAGVGGALPVVVNSFLTWYAILALGALHRGESAADAAALRRANRALRAAESAGAAKEDEPMAPEAPHDRSVRVSAEP